MKSFFKNFLVFMAVSVASLSMINLVSAPSASARSLTNDCYFIGLVAPDCGVIENPSGTDDLRSIVVTIAVNVLNDAAVIAAYLVVAYTIYGGYRYIFANGDPGKVAAGKKTLTRAFIGLAIVGSANAILSAIRLGLANNSVSFDQNCTAEACIDGISMVTNTISWFITMAGIVAAIYLVTAGIGYITANGDTGKLQKSKNGILYSLIGLAIVALSQIIVTFVGNMVRSANTTSFIETKNIAIVKEITDENQIN